MEELLSLYLVDDSKVIIEIIKSFIDDKVFLIKTFQDRNISQQSLQVMVIMLYGKIVIGFLGVLLFTWLLQHPISDQSH